MTDRTTPAPNGTPRGAVDGAPAADRALLTRLPKAELHCHLDGSVRPATLLELGAEQGVAMPRDTAEALGEYMRVDDARNLEEYLARFDVTLAVLQTEAALERAAYELAVDAAAEGVRYLEVRYAPVLNTRGAAGRPALGMDGAVEAALNGLARAERDADVVARVLVCAIRNQSEALAMDAARVAVEYRRRGVVGFDLAGGEAGHPATRFARAFEHARAHDLACTCHAGEGAGAESVRDAVHGCGCDRVGHGTRIIEDASLLDYLVDRRTCVECCLTSNVQTRAASSYEGHPFRRYFDRGLNVTLNTDNRLMSGTTLVDEYARAAERLGFTAAELARVARNGFESAFLPYAEREALLARLAPEFAAVEAGARSPWRGCRVSGRPSPATIFDAAPPEAQAAGQYGAAAARAAADAVRDRLGVAAPACAIVLGSGLGALADDVGDARRVPFAEVPGFPDATVVGHAGALVGGTLAGRPVLLLAGRFHAYEGHPAALAAFPVRVLHALGARTVFLSNAAGGVRRTFAPGDLMVIADHLNLTGRSPLVGPQQDGDQRFPDMTEAYDAGLRRLLRDAAAATGQAVQEGVYAGLLGPAYETPAEVRMLERLGADAVGMSTVPEAIVARAIGMRVAGVSCVTNKAAGVAHHPLDHAEVLEVGRAAAGRFRALVTEFVRRLD